ncbi:reverse transcriptase domain-containing protein [Tanacetum coccineum]|uniref:Reverse transcriptase domain-containing protein n=1 Tax=Tanacetum coccineum TaxID=301880 RepID=A0ABQ5F9U1_9ASTR
MADNRTMAQMLQAPIEGYEDAIVVPPINANNFELKQPLINLCKINKLHGRDAEIDALDSAAGGNFLDKMPREGLAIIESKSKVRYSRSRPNDSRAITNAPSSTSSPSNNSFEIQQMAALLETKSSRMLLSYAKFVSDVQKDVNNKDKLIELTKTPLNENCSAVILKKLPEKLGRMIQLHRKLMKIIWTRGGLLSFLENLFSIVYPFAVHLIRKLPYQKIKKELKVCKYANLQSMTSRVVELYDNYQPHLEYVFLADNNKLPVIIAKYLSNDEKTALIECLPSRKWLNGVKTTNLALIGKKAISLVKERYLTQQPLREFEVFSGMLVFIEDLSKTFQRSLRPNAHLLEKKQLLSLLERCILAFKTLKKKLRSSNFHCSELGLPLNIMCDASDYAIGAVLGQRIKKHFRPIHYASKTMTEAETNYTTTEKEMLAVVYAFEKFRSILDDTKVLFTRPFRF